jgi:asparagine synthetase B (glutamine-hydrolysing)
VTPHRLRPTPLEVATNAVFGEDAQAEALPETVLSAPAALEQAALPALERPPCLVSFSGGRDSSIVLAAAARAARREGLPPPVPATFRFPGSPLTDEAEWQERVVRHLGLDDWHRQEIGDELDLVGPVSTEVLRRHGLLYPATAFFFAPLLKHARGGSLLTGAGGDELLSGGRWRRAVDVLAGRHRPRRRDVLHVAYLAAPAPLRRAVARRRGLPSLPWLRPEAKREFEDAWASGTTQAPARWSKYVAWLRRRRYLAAQRWSFGLLASDEGAVLVDALFDPGFLASVARAGGQLGVGDRSAVMLRLFSGLLPDELLSRPDKTSFQDVFWGRHTREFTKAWTGGGVDRELVDEATLRNVWADPVPHHWSGMLVQSAWLATSRARSAERREAV